MKKWGFAGMALSLYLGFGQLKCAAQVLNMSHDLVSMGIAAQDLTPNNSSLDARPLFQAAVTYVESHPIATLTLDTGSYYFLTPEFTGTYLGFFGLSNLTVNLAGSTIYFQQAFLQGFIEQDCQNFTLTNFSTDFLNPPYTHVQVTSVNAGQRTISYNTLAGWPDPSTFNNVTTPFGTPDLWAVAFRNSQVVPGTSRMPVSRPISNSTLALIQDGAPWTQGPTLSTLQPGDIIAVTERGGQSPLLAFRGDSITFSYITIYGSSAFAVQMDSLSNSVADHIRVMPRPVTGLIGSNADGIHFTSSRQNNQITNCYVTRTLDDALAMDSLYLATVQSETPPFGLTATRSYYYRFANGTPVNFVHSASAAEIAGATIASQNPPDSPSPVFQGTVQLTFGGTLPSLSAGDGMVFGSAAMRGAGSVIEDNLVEDLPFSRGIWIGGNQGVTLQRNVIRKTSNGGIVLSSDTLYYPGPGSGSVTVDSNALEVTLGPEASGSGSQIALGGIVVETTDVTGNFASTTPNTNISLLNNYIADAGRSGIWLGTVNGGTIDNNLVIRWNRFPNLPIWGIDPSVTQDFATPIVVHYSSNVTSQGNTTDLNSTISAPVTFDRTYLTLPSGGTAGIAMVSTAVPGFAWKATTDSSWITLTPPVLGADAGNIAYSVAANNGTQARAGNILTAGESLPVLQAGTSQTTPALHVAVSHSGAFVDGQASAVYSAVISNAASAQATLGAVSVTESLPQQMTLVSMGGSGWACSSSTCMRSDALVGGSSYPAITIIVQVAANAPASVTNQVSASGGGSAAAIANDMTAIAPSACDVNQDRNTNVSDAQVTINEGLGLAMAFNDLNHDGAVNIADAQIVINAILGGGCSGH